MNVCRHCGLGDDHRLGCPVPIANQILRHLPRIADMAHVSKTDDSSTRIVWHRRGGDIEVEWQHNQPIDLHVTFFPGQFEAVADAIAEIVAQAIDRPRRDLG